MQQQPIMPQQQPMMPQQQPMIPQQQQMMSQQQPMLQQQQQMMAQQQPMLQQQQSIPQHQQQMPQQMQPQQQPVQSGAQITQQLPSSTTPQSTEEISNHIFNPHQFNILRTQIHSYKLIIRNEQVPQKIIDVLKSKPSTQSSVVVPQQQPVPAINGQPQVQHQSIQMNAQQIRMRKKIIIFYLMPANLRQKLYEF